MLRHDTEEVRKLEEMDILLSKRLLKVENFFDNNFQVGVFCVTIEQKYFVFLYLCKYFV